MITLLLVVASAAILWRLSKWIAIRIRAIRTLGWFRFPTALCHLENCLKYGHEGAIVILDGNRSNSFVQFKKYCGPDGEIGLDAVIPLRGGRRDMREDLNELKRYFNLKAEEVISEYGLRFMFLDMGGDVDFWREALPPLMKILGFDEKETMRLGDDSLHTKEISESRKKHLKVPAHRYVVDQ
jgi:hypothetical protein